MAYSFLGFSQLNGIRRFAFLHVLADGSRTEIDVDADMQTARTCNIKLQDLPLMCRHMLEAQTEGVESRALTLTEADMHSHAPAAETARKGRGRTPKPVPPLAGEVGPQSGPRSLAGLYH